MVEIFKCNWAVLSTINENLFKQIQSEGVESGLIDEFNIEFDFASTNLSSMI